MAAGGWKLPGPGDGQPCAAAPLRRSWRGACRHTTQCSGHPLKEATRELKCLSSLCCLLQYTALQAEHWLHSTLTAILRLNSQPWWHEG